MYRASWLAPAAWHDLTSQSCDSDFRMASLLFIRIVSRGKMEHGGKMEHLVFWKNHARRGSIFKCTWFLSSANSASCMEIKLAIDHAFSISQNRNFTLLMYQFTRDLTSSALTNQVVETLHVVKYNYVPVVHIFTSFDWAINIYKRFPKEHSIFLIKISLMFIVTDVTDYKPTLVQVMVWRRTVDKPIPEPMLTRVPHKYMTSLGS